MRDEPSLIDRIAREAPAEMIVDAAVAHLAERQFDELEETRIVATQTSAPEKFEHRALRKFRCTAQAAMSVVEDPPDRCGGGIEFGRADDDTPGRTCAIGETRHQRFAVVIDL